MKKIVQIATGQTSYDSWDIDREGYQHNEDHILYALDEEGKVYRRNEVGKWEKVKLT